MSTMNAENLIPSADAIAEAIDTRITEAHSVAMVDYSFHLPFVPAKGKTIYKAIAEQLDVARAPHEVQRTATLAVGHATRAFKVTKTGLVSPTPAQWLEDAFKQIVGPSAYGYHTNAQKSRPYPTLSVDAEGLTPEGRTFFQVSTGKDTESDIRTWQGCAPAVLQMIKGLREGGRHEIMIVDRSDAEVIAHKFTLNFKHEVTGSNMDRKSK